MKLRKLLALVLTAALLLSLAACGRQATPTTTTVAPTTGSAGTTNPPVTTVPPTTDVPNVQFDPGCEKLSEMTDEKAFAFLEYHKIDVPESQMGPNTNLALTLRRCIRAIEEDPLRNPYAFYSEPMENFGKAIYDAVLVYYGWEVPVPPDYSFDPGCEKLSEMTNEKVQEFLDYYFIKVPENFYKPSVILPDLVRQNLTYIEENKSNPYAARSDKDVHFFGRALLAAAEGYYGWDTTA